MQSMRISFVDSNKRESLTNFSFSPSTKSHLYIIYKMYKYIFLMSENENFIFSIHPLEYKVYFMPKKCD